ncbi:unnamed protein product [Strongylus vulgaris]|uniref:Uncharacterized protein n=1 Tax=Strongylus vulgaris TaxID=40348 RepID=A0A3P7IT61_STRVU|nr:unnamed protein product [Strongylus vulgaris]
MLSTDFAVRDRIGKNIQGNGTCYVTEGTNLLGLEWCIQFLAYKELKNKYHCRKEQAVPVFKKKRPVPYATAPELEEEIDWLVAEGVISARWKLILLAYDLDLDYRKTTEFGQADALSRLIPPKPFQTEEVVMQG